MTTNAPRLQRREVVRLRLGIVAVSVLALLGELIVSAIYTPVAKNYGIYFPYWVTVLVPAVGVVVVYFALGREIAESRFHHLSFRRSLEKQFLWGLLFLPVLVILTETILLYSMDFILGRRLYLGLSISIVFIWYDTIVGVVLGVSCSLAINWFSQSKIKARLTR